MGGALPRLEHWLLRSQRGVLLFRDDLDRNAFLRLMTRNLLPAGVTCTAWALAPHHVELLLAPAANVAASGAPLGIENLSVEYARRFNARHGRTGYLFVVPTPPRLVEQSPRVAEVVRYIHRTPLATGEVPNVDELTAYEWAGHASLSGRRPPLPFEDFTSVERFIPGLDPRDDDLFRAWMERGA